MAIPTATAPSTIVKASVSNLPEELNVQWLAAGWALEDVAVVDARHLVLVFFAGHASPILGAGDPGQLTKYTDNEDHAPYQGKCLKLGTLRHYREQHQELEGTWDPMEGIAIFALTALAACTARTRSRPYRGHRRTRRNHPRHVPDLPRETSFLYACPASQWWRNSSSEFVLQRAESTRKRNLHCPLQT